MLFKVTKIRYRIPYNETEYVVDKKSTTYTTNKGAVTLACKHAREENFLAERYEQQTGRKHTYKYEVQIEVGDLPETKPAVYCEKHGVQPAFNVPGLTSGLTCVDCILPANLPVSHSQKESKGQHHAWSEANTTSLEAHPTAGPDTAAVTSVLTTRR